MPIPTEPVGSVPRPQAFLDATAAWRAGQLPQQAYDALCDELVRETIAAFEATGSPIVTDGEQTKVSFVGYPLDGLTNLAPDGLRIDFADGHHRALPRLTAGPFRYARYSGEYVARARQFATRPLKQAVIAPSALSLIYPADGLHGYTRDDFLVDLIGEAERDIRSCFEAGAVTVQLDFTEGRLATKLDPSLGLLREFVRINNVLLDRFTPEDRARISVHTCPGGDHDSTHSADADYACLLPDLFLMRAGAFMCELAGEPHPEHALAHMRDHVGPNQKVFVGVINVLDPRVETPEEVADRICLAAQYIPLAQLGVTDDCGFSPFGDDMSTAREMAFAKIKARIDGIRIAEQRLGIA